MGGWNICLADLIAKAFPLITLTGKTECDLRILNNACSLLVFIDQRLQNASATSSARTLRIIAVDISDNFINREKGFPGEDVAPEHHKNRNSRNVQPGHLRLRDLHLRRKLHLSYSLCLPRSREGGAGVVPSAETRWGSRARNSLEDLRREEAAARSRRWDGQGAHALPLVEA